MKSAGYEYCLLSTPIGPVGVAAFNDAVADVWIGLNQDHLLHAIVRKFPSSVLVDDGMAARACLQLGEYFRGERRGFDLRLDWSGRSDFALSILHQLALLPFGETLTYGDLAGRAGYPGRARATGQVMAANRLPLILPCHRIIGSGGRLSGYSGGEGIKTKRWLLDFENKIMMKNIG
ncbi:MAG: hypothetical protein A2X84_00980 [Desulfuromonadaceae bacterium GWC2_58_13]|nr:MAG: hypothetical protein A2X84_00980 [Desulfuromonadaceae bacterium GWC2_58_13]